MTAKEYLEQLPNIRLRIRAIRRRIAECDDRATHITSNFSGTPSQHNGGASSKVADNVVAKVELESELDAIAKEFEAFEHRAALEINRLPDNLYSALLFEKYINGLTWEQVAEAIQRDADYTRKELHSKALTSFDEIIPADTRKNPVIPPQNMVD